ncbi:carboxypeptidase S3, penicillopeptidase S3, CPD-S3 [Trichodelitschia bisporula]|uniref:Carboxypeptidase n=1 Tax=Trichodelitschia bisporula TaxID=703511 RepID=A0A6G1I490_9PEZI|nr:carboxypeptidase S3, penicillopeptidase S3, CPD-S3 [Trichodelitschia bisporula]
MFFSSVLHIALLAAASAAVAVPNPLPSELGPFAKLNAQAKTKAKLEERDDASAKYRFLSDATQQYQVTSLPDVPFTLGEFYSGSMPIKTGDTSRELFFVFQPTIGAPVDEITIWLNGGPGCSSLEGFFQENGLYVWREGDPAPIQNPWSWVNVTNMLWVEQPVGTGYTTGTPTAKTEEEIARDFVGFLGNFMKAFSISNFKIYVTGESYAGRYVPYIASAILDKKDPVNFNLSGAIVYDPCIGQFDYVQQQVPAYPFIKANSNFFKFSTSTMNRLANLHQSCGYQRFLDTYLTFPAKGLQPPVRTQSGCNIFNTAYSAAQSANPCFNVYEINQTCPTPQDVMSDNIFPDGAGGQTNYFDRPDVKAALHAPASSQWTECSNQNVFVGRGGPENEGDLSADSIQYVLPRVIDATKRVLVANGDYDMIIMTQGTLLSIQNMTWGGSLGFSQKPATPINIPAQGNMGIQHYERGLMWGETYESGHMGPQYQPAVAWRHLAWLRGEIESL